MKKVIILLLLCFALVGCGDGTKTKLDEIIDGGNYIVLDVRTRSEYDSNHVKGSLNIPYDEIDDDVSLDKSKTILVYCKSGNRSSKAYTSLVNLGYDVYDMGAIESVPLEKE